MKKTAAALAAALSLALAAGVGAATVPVTSLSGDFAATNSSLRLTPDGVNFGVYPDASSGGSLYFAGANGLTLADLADLDYTFSYTANDEPENYTAAPYMRVFLEGDAHDVILDPSHCATSPVPHSTPVHLQMVGNLVRYDDDGCSTLPESPWADVVAAHGDEVVSGVYVTQGFAVGTAFSANVTNLSLNGDVYVFGAPQGGPAGPPGPTTIVQAPTQVTQPVSVGAPLTVNCKGDELRTVHAPRLRGWHFVSVRATLRGRSLKTRGRAVTVDLRGREESNYNVRLSTRYLSEGGRSRLVKTTRNLSVVCA